MKGGEQRTLVSFQRRSSARNEFAEQKDAWRDIVTTWAKVEPLVGKGEFFAALAVQTDATMIITCRYSQVLAGIVSKDRIVCGAVIYDITAQPLDKDMRHRELQFLCVQHVDE